MGTIKISQIIDHLDQSKEEYTFLGNISAEISGYSSFNSYKIGTITWVRSSNVFEGGSNNLKHVIKLLVAPLDFNTNARVLNCIKTENPHRVFFYILKVFFGHEKPYTVGKYNVISSSAKIGDCVAIGNNCVIGEQVEIGYGTRISDNVVIKNNVKIGKNCLIQAGAIIGEEGFGFLITKQGVRERVQHLGGVIICDNVEIGSHTCIVRGVMEDTIIGEGSKIDNLCHIAHNVKIDENCVIVACSEISGSVHIGQGSWLGPNCSILDGIKIGEGCFIGMGAVVIKTLPPNVVAAGSPARILREKK
jgi:UDP-3-O-[3-hydroxymyristoyl] glucosamine N-acyltransferase